MFRKIKPIVIVFLFNCLFSQPYQKDDSSIIVGDTLSSGGSSWIDYDNDRDLDVFISNGNLNPQRNKLFQNDGTGNFTEVLTGEIVNELASSIGSTWGDVDNDGDLDCFITNRALADGTPTRNFLYLNDGSPNFTFTKVTDGDIATNETNGNMAQWIDIENDGDLDLFLINFSEENILYLNDGAGSLTKTDIDPIKQSSLSICAAWADYDNNGFVDLFVGNAGGETNFLYRNNGDLTFSQITDGDVVTDAANTTGCAWADFNNDGYLDLIAANFLLTANNLYLNDGPPNYTFTSIKDGFISNDQASSIGTAWGDINLDGFLDLAVGNGLLENNSMYFKEANLQNTDFTRNVQGVFVNDGGNSFGVALIDFDKDGDLDAYVANINDSRNYFYQNNESGKNWVSIKCVGTSSNISALGTKVKLKANISGKDFWQLREVSSQSGYNSQSSYELFFGLNDAAIIDSISIQWPSGIRETFTNIEPNKFYTAIEGDGFDVVTSVEVDDTQIPESFQLFQNYPNPFNPSTKIDYFLPTSTGVKLRIFNILGQEIRSLVNGFQQGGYNNVVWDGKDNTGNDVVSGIYLYKLEAGSKFEIRKMILLK